METLKEAFEVWAESIKVGFAGGREATIGASEIGKCARMVGYKKKGIDRDASYVESSGFTTRGSIMEDAVIVPIVRTWVAAHGGKLLWAGQSEQMRIEDLKNFAAATPDGLATNMPRDCLAPYGVVDIGKSEQLYLEFKSIDPRANEGKLPKPEHVAQVNYAMGLVRRADKTLKPEFALIVYVDASDYSKISAYPVKYDHDGFKAQIGKARGIMSATDPETLRPEGKIEGGGDCRYCEFSERCLGYSAMVPKAVQGVDTETAEEIAAVARAIVEVGDDIKALGLDKSRLEAELRELLIAAQTKRVDAGEFRVSWTSVAGRASYDNDGLRAAAAKKGIDVDAFKKEGKPSDRLQVEALSKA